MAEEVIKACIDRILPDHLLIPSAEKAVRENSANAPANPEGKSIQEIAILTSNLWQPGRVLHVRFLDGDPAVQAKVQQYAQQWSEYANIQFVFDASLTAEIHISFKQPGSWSYIGTDCLSIAQDQPTMNYGWLTPTTQDDEYSRVVLHEFGHALGCIHEHQNPTAGIPWNTDAVYRYYEGPPNNWTKDQVDANLFQKYSQTQTQFTTWDPTSIMEYPIPSQFTTNGIEVGWNRVLSNNDKQFMSAHYPYQMTRIGPAGIQANPFDDTEDAKNLGQPLTQVSVRHGNIIDAIQTFYGSGQTALSSHGGAGGSRADIVFDPGDALEEVAGFYGRWFGGNYILQLTFHTRNGKVYGPYGDMNNASTRTPFSLKANSNAPVIAFFGSVASSEKGVAQYLGSIGITVR